MAINFLIRAAALRELIGEVCAVLQVVTDNLVHIGKLKVGKILNDFLSRRAPIEGIYDEVERDPGAADTLDTVRVSCQRNGIDHFLGHTERQFSRHSRTGAAATRWP